MTKLTVAFRNFASALANKMRRECDDRVGQIRRQSDVTHCLRGSMNFHSGSRVILRWRTGLKKLIVAFRNFVNAPKNVTALCGVCLDVRL